jgi:hypothetical protein
MDCDFFINKEYSFLDAGLIPGHQLRSELSYEQKTPN